MIATCRGIRPAAIRGARTPSARSRGGRTWPPGGPAWPGRGGQGPGRGRPAERRQLPGQGDLDPGRREEPPPADPPGPGCGVQQAGPGRGDRVEPGQEHPARGRDQDGRPRVPSGAEAGLVHPAPGRADQVGQHALHRHRPPPPGQVLGGAGKAVQDLGRDREQPLAEIPGQVGQIVGQLDAVQEPRDRLAVPQRDRHVHPGPVQQDQDLPGPRAVRPPRPRPPVIPGDQRAAIHVAGQNLERGPQVSHVKPPPHDGVHQRPADHVGAGPRRQLSVQGTDPRLQPGRPLRRLPRAGVHDVIRRRQRRPQRPATRPQHPRHQGRQRVDRRITPTDRPPAPAVRLPQPRPGRTLSSTTIPAKGRHRPRRQPTSSDHHAPVSRQFDRTCEGLHASRTSITIASSPTVSVAMCRFPAIETGSVDRAADACRRGPATEPSRGVALRHLKCQIAD